MTRHMISERCTLCVLCVLNVYLFGKTMATATDTELHIKDATLTGKSFNGYHDPVSLSRIIRDLSHSRLFKREAVISAPNTPITCNANSEQSNWTCVCSGCFGSNDRCCLSVLDPGIVNQSVIITVYNSSTIKFTSILEAEIKAAVSTAISNYCSEYSYDCDLFVMKSMNGSSVSTSKDVQISADHVIIINATSWLAEETSKSDHEHLMAVTLFVSLPTRVTQDDSASKKTSAQIVEASFLQKVLLNQNVSLEEALRLKIKSIKVFEPIPVPGLPVKGIVAGVILGFILVLSCIISAVKAVRDRRLIKQRNATKREQKEKRHKELRDSFRKSPLKKKLSSVDSTGNGNMISVPPSNGTSLTQLPSSVSPQVVQVVVHSDYEKNTGDGNSFSKNSVAVENLPDDAINHNTYPEINDMQRISGSDDVHVPNGHVVDRGGETDVIPQTNVSSPKHLPISRENDNPDNMDIHENNTDAYHSDHVASLPEDLPDSIANDDSEHVEESPERNKQVIKSDERPGIVNKAYARE